MLLSSFSNKVNSEFQLYVYSLGERAIAWYKQSLTTWPSPVISAMKQHTIHYCYAQSYLNMVHLNIIYNQDVTNVECNALIMRVLDTLYDGN